MSAPKTLDDVAAVLGISVAHESDCSTFTLPGGAQVTVEEDGGDWVMTLHADGDNGPGSDEGEVGDDLGDVVEVVRGWMRARSRVGADLMACGECGAQGRMLVHASGLAICGACEHAVSRADVEPYVEPGDALVWDVGRYVAVVEAVAR